MSSNPRTYDSISQLLHWLMAFLLAAMVGIGYGRDFLPPLWRDPAMDFHKSLGISFLLLILIRILWATMRRAPDHSQDQMIERLAARLVHFGLYVFMILMPVTGWVLVSAWGRPVSWFNLFNIPSIIEKNRNLAVQFKEYHETLAIIGLTLIGLHVAAALFHHFIRKDDVLKRMIPTKR